MIAYVDPDMRVHVANSDGSEQRLLDAPGRAHTWPVWSPKAGRLAFSGISSGSNGRGRLGLYLHDLGDGPAQTLFENEPGSDALAQRTPHYALWSPDGTRLAFVARTNREGLTLFVVDVSREGAAEPVIDGFPIFLSWSPDSRWLLLHCGQDHFMVDFEANGKVEKMPGGSSLYMAPSWSPVANVMGVMRQGDQERQGLLVGNATSGEASLVTELEGGAAFSWSPNGGRIALARDPHESSRFYRGLWLIDADGSQERRLSEDLVLCFFWSPDGAEIAYITPAQEASESVRWGVVDSESGATRYLADFRPSEEQVNTFMFFDQYAQSHNPWSPDGQKLIFSGVVAEADSGSALPQAHQASVLVADVDGRQPPAPVAKGFLGFWAPG